MMRSLYSAVSGLKAHQTRMDVIGNNIANVNTVGFKSSSVTFTDVLYQTTQSASGPNANQGIAGTNALQIGLGSGVGAITKNMDQGASQSTGNAFDLMINGDAFFVVKQNGENLFTKAGSFTTDANGTLCTTTGATVMGWQVNDKGEIVRDQVSQLDIMSAENKYSAPKATESAHLTGNITPSDPQLKDGLELTIPIYDNLGNTYNAVCKIKPTTTDGKYTLSLVNVLDKEGKGLPSAYTVKLGTSECKYDDTGKVTLSGTDVEVIFNHQTGKFESVGGAGKTSLDLSISGTPNSFMVPDPTEKTAASGTTGGTTTTTNGGTANIDVDFSGITNFTTTSASTIAGARGTKDGKNMGRLVGNMSGVSISDSGEIYGVYSNGDKKLLGQIAVATFENPAGLEAVGNSMYRSSLNSGDFDGIGVDVSSVGSVTSGVLEMSNVDLAQEFTDMIVTQRGYQANSRIITTTDTLLEELINLKR